MKVLSFTNYRSVNYLILGLSPGGSLLLQLCRLLYPAGQSENIAFKEVIVLPISLIFLKDIHLRGY